MSGKSIRRRLERLEASMPKWSSDHQKWAIVEFYPIEGEKHLELVSSGPGQCQFIERPGPGPQLKDYGDFDPVFYMSECEMRA
jgi:hypothetical protein